MVAINTSQLSERLSEFYDKLSSGDSQAIAIAAGGAAAVALAGTYLFKRSSNQTKPTVFDLSGGAIDDAKVKKEWDNYEASYGKEAGEGIKDRSKTSQLVDVFYSLVTDFYEWGWGQSFHFSPKLPAKTWAASEAAHEARVACNLGLKPGMRCLDCGCGVGGPMRTIAAVSGANIVGITINQYQVDRANLHNKKSGMEPLCDVVRGNFLEMPFEEASFDAAYAIEATCHAAKLEEVYAEVFRVLKPGGLFLSYEWVATKNFDPKNPEHVRIIDEINFGNGLPEMRTYSEAEDAGKTVGFELVTSIDLATASKVAGPWYSRLADMAWRNKYSHALVSTLDAFWLAPRGLKQVHNMLVNVATSLVAGGETDVFSPMHMLVFRKPAA
eukprot:jgi/Chrzof1/1805/Cz10g21220.t1